MWWRPPLSERFSHYCFRRFVKGCRSILHLLDKNSHSYSILINNLPDGWFCRLVYRSFPWWRNCSLHHRHIITNLWKTLAKVVSMASFLILNQLNVNCSASTWHQTRVRDTKYSGIFLLRIAFIHTFSCNTLFYHKSLIFDRISTER